MSTEQQTDRSAESTEAVAKPVPDGFGILRNEWLKANPIPNGSKYFNHDENKWIDSTWTGMIGRLCSACYIAPLNSAPPEAFAQPTPAGPTAGDSMDVHYAELQAENQRLKGENDELRLNEERTRGYLLGAWYTIRDRRQSLEGKGHICDYRKCCDSLFDQLDSELKRRPAELNPWGRIHREVIELRTLLTAAETKAGAMEKRIAELEVQLVAIGDLAVVDWDSETVGKVDAIVKDPIRYKDRLKALFNDIPKQRDAALARAETAEAASRRMEDGIRGAIDIATGHGERTPYLYNVEEALRKLLLPPAPSVASEKEGKISTEGGDEPCTTPVSNAAATVVSADIRASNAPAAVQSHSAGPTLLPFDLAKALAGAKVVTRDGREVRDLHLTSGAICGYVEGSMFTSYWNYNGWFQKHEGSPLDLFLAPTP